MAKSTEKYEVLYILNPNLTEEETQGIVEKFKTLIEQNGTIDEMEEWGKRKLAYEINYLSEGYYVLVKFTSAPAFPATKNLSRIALAEPCGTAVAAASPAALPGRAS